MKLKLYEISKDMERALSMFEQAETPEEQRKLQEVISRMEIAEGEKLSNICASIKNDLALASTIKEEEARLSKKRKSLEAQAERKKSYVSLHFKRDKWTNGIHSLSFRKSETLEIEEGAVIPETYLKPQPPKIDKVKIKADLKQDAVIPGCSIKINHNLQVK